jgi:hypothetical protein
MLEKKQFGNCFTIFKVTPIAILSPALAHLVILEENKPLADQNYFTRDEQKCQKNFSGSVLRSQKHPSMT